MRKGSKARFANGVVSAIIVVFFLVHGLLGSLAPITGFYSPFAGLVWLGIALVGVHVVLSVVTSWQQLSDPERPASPRKKRHLALKWATGVLFAVAVAAHVVAVRTLGAVSMHAHVSGALVIVLVAVLFAVHVCVGSKSLLKDLGVDRSRKMAVRVTMCVFAAVFAVLAIAVLLL